MILGEADILWIFIVFVFLIGRPEEQDDSENSTIYITGLTEKANLEEMAEFFKHVGPIRVRIALNLNGVIVGVCDCLKKKRWW